MTASGYGSGELIVDGKVVPLIGRPQMCGGNMRGTKAAARGANNWPTLSVKAEGTVPVSCICHIIVAFSRDKCSYGDEGDAAE